MDYLPEIRYPYKFIEFIEEKNNKFTDIRYGKSLHLRNNREIYIHHILINMASEK